jgi:hypothetical protein
LHVRHWGFYGSPFTPEYIFLIYTAHNLQAESEFSIKFNSGHEPYLSTGLPFKMSRCITILYVTECITVSVILYKLGGVFALVGTRVFPHIYFEAIITNVEANHLK